MYQRNGGALEALFISETTAVKQRRRMDMTTRRLMRKVLTTGLLAYLGFGAHLYVFQRAVGAVESVGFAAGRLAPIDA